MHDPRPTLGATALEAMWRADEASGIDPLAVPRAIEVPAQPAPAVPQFRIDPPPWSEHYVPEPYVDSTATEVVTEEPSARPSQPPRREELDVGTAPPGPRPRIEETKRWMAEQMRSER